MSKKILVIEDDPFLVKMYDVGLKHEGFTVEQAFDGEQGLEKAKSAHPDIILLDLMLPKLSGFEVLTALKKDRSTQRIPVLILSNLSQQTDKKRVMDLGAIGFLEKNKFTVKQIAQIVNQQLSAIHAHQSESVSA